MLLILFITVITTKVDLCGPQHILEKCIAIPIILLFFQAILKFQVDLNIKTTRMLCYLKPEASPLDDKQKTLSLPESILAALEYPFLLDNQSRRRIH